MKRIQASFLLLALVCWLVPRQLIAEEKHTAPTEPVVENWVISKADITPEQSAQLYQEWEQKSKVRPKPKTVPVAGVEAPTEKQRNTNFAKGNCTAYVAQKVVVTWRGNANRWLPNAKAQGYRTDRIPEAGAILVTNESRAGHVAYIEEVNGSEVTFSEWNVAGKYKKTVRTFNINDKRIVGIIHLN